MLKAMERECLFKFFDYHTHEILEACRDAGCKFDSIKTKISSHKTAENNFRPRPLTQREGVMLASFLRRQGNEFVSWCKSYEVDRVQLFSALGRMTK